MITANDIVGPLATLVLNTNGIVTHETMRQYVRDNFDLDAHDMAPSGEGSAYQHRYQSKVNDLTTNSTLIKYDMNIVRVSGGYTTRQYATENNIAEMIRGDRSPRTSRATIVSTKPSRKEVLNSVVEFYKNNKTSLTTEVRSARDKIVDVVLDLADSSDDLAYAVELAMLDYAK